MQYPFPRKDFLWVLAHRDHITTDKKKEKKERRETLCIGNILPSERIFYGGFAHKVHMTTDKDKRLWEIFEPVSQKHSEPTLRSKLKPNLCVWLIITII